MKKITAILSAVPILMLVSSCGGTKSAVPESLAEIKAIVAQLDSDVSEMYGWEPRDSTYNHATDSLVSSIIDEYEKERPDANIGERTEHAIEQEAYDDARVTWAEFKRLCDADKYKDALDFYFSEGDDYIKKNAGDFLVFLKHSTQRYVFFSQVLLPLMREYRGDTFAIDHFIDVMELEKAMEDASIAMSADTDGYVPEVYPLVIQELGYALGAAGRMEEAQDLFDDLIYGIYSLSGDALSANFYGTRYSANLYMKDGNPNKALAMWDYFKDYLDENKSDYDPENLEHCLQRIEEEKSEISSLDIDND